MGQVMLQPGSVHVLHTYEFALMQRKSDYMALPNAVVVVLPNQLTHKQRLELMDKAAIIVAASRGTPISVETVGNVSRTILSSLPPSG